MTGATPAAVPRRPLFDRALIPELVIDANDGIIATAGLVEGLMGAGATGNTVLIAAVAAMVAGSISMGGAKFTEYAAEEDSRRSIIAEEERQLATLPEAELAELADLYVAKGLPPDLAMQVAQALTAHDALTAHIEAEHGLGGWQRTVRPILVAVHSGIAFVLGSLVPLLAVLLTPDSWRVPVIFVAVVAALCCTAAISARVGHASVSRNILRTLSIGILSMGVGFVVGHGLD